MWLRVCAWQGRVACSGLRSLEFLEQGVALGNLGFLKACFETCPKKPHSAACLPKQHALRAELD